MSEANRLLLVGSVLYFVGSVIFTIQAIQAGDFWASIGSVAFLVSSGCFVGATVRNRFG